MDEDTNPAAGIAHDGDMVTVKFYDTDSEDNVKSDPIVEQSYEMHESVFRDEFAARVDTALDLDMILDPETMMMFIDRRALYVVLDEMDNVERVE